MVIPGYLVVSSLMAAIALATLFAMVWLHRKSGICVALGGCVVASALIIDASTGAAWMGGRWTLFMGVGGGLIALGVASGLIGRRSRRSSRKPAPPDVAPAR